MEAHYRGSDSAAMQRLGNDDFPVMDNIFIWSGIDTRVITTSNIQRLLSQLVFSQKVMNGSGIFLTLPRFEGLIN